MRWFPDRLMLLLEEVEINLYTLVLEYCFLRNAVTLLCVKVPLEETENVVNN